MRWKPEILKKIVYTRGLDSFFMIYYTHIQLKIN